MSNFSSVPNRHGPSAGQMAVAAGLIQQRQQVGLSRQQVGLQKKSLDAQNQANSLAAAQLSEMQKIEENRKREKLLDVWSAEFQHRGMSPLESHTQALAEMEFMDLIVRFQEYSELYSHQSMKAISNIKTKRKVKVNKLSLVVTLLSILPYSILWLSHDPSTPTNRLGISPYLPHLLLNFMFISLFIVFPISLVVILSQFLSSYKLREESTEEEQEVATRPYLQEFLRNIRGVDSKLNTLPLSQLSDDSEFRVLVKSLVQKES